MLSGVIGVVLGVSVLFALKAPRPKRVASAPLPIPTQPGTITFNPRPTMIQFKHITATSCPSCGAEVSADIFPTVSSGIEGANTTSFVERNGERSEQRGFVCGASVYWDVTAGPDSEVCTWGRCRNSADAMRQREKRIAFKAAFEKFLAEADVDKNCIDNIKHHVHIWID